VEIYQRLDEHAARMRSRILSQGGSFTTPAPANSFVSPAEETFLAALFVRTVSLAVVVAFPRMPIGSWADGLV
jgi:hypothetical protein